MNTRLMFLNLGYTRNSNHKIGDAIIVKDKEICYNGKIVELRPDVHGILWGWVEYYA